MQVGCGPWIRWLVSRIKSCADKVGGGWERGQIQRTAKRYDDDCDGKNVGLRLLLLAAVVMTASPTNEQTSDDKDKRHGAKLVAALRRVRIPSPIVCFQPINIYLI